MVYIELGLSAGWASVLGLVTALILGPAVDAGIGSFKGGDDAKDADDDSVSP